MHSFSMAVVKRPNKIKKRLIMLVISVKNISYIGSHWEEFSFLILVVILVVILESLFPLVTSWKMILAFGLNGENAPVTDKHHEVLFIK